MKKSKFLYLMVAVLIGFASCEKDDVEATYTLNLENLLTKPDSTWVGDTSGTVFKKTEKSTTYLNQFGDDFFLFDNYYTVSDWTSWSGFAVTNGTDTKTGDYSNNSAITGKGVDGKVYLTANIGGAYSPVAKISFKDKKTREVEGMYITNTTYAYKVVENGNKFSKKFTDGDWFKLKIVALDMNNARKDSTEIYLADFREGKTEILNTWKWVSTKKFGKVKSFVFDLSSSDTGQYGMNTPSYFCVDGITVIE